MPANNGMLSGIIGISIRVGTALMQVLKQAIVSYLFGSENYFSVLSCNCSRQPESTCGFKMNDRMRRNLHFQFRSV